jgi:hypothetical protein
VGDEYDEDGDDVRDSRSWPWWVSLGLWGLPGRGWAWGCFWLSVLIAAGSAVAGFYYWPAFFGVLFVFAAAWYFAAIRWVDRNGEWP